MMVVSFFRGIESLCNFMGDEVKSETKHHLDELKERLREIDDLRMALYLLDWDQST